MGRKSSTLIIQKNVKEHRKIRRSQIESVKEDISSQITEPNDQNVFRIKNRVPYARQIVVQFPLYQSIQGSQKCSVPTYRQDNLYYTPGFSLSDEFNKEFIEEQLTIHQQRMQCQAFQIDQQRIKEPKPSQHNFYCMSCQIKYEDYREHIKQDQHRSKLQKSKINHYIYELCENIRLERLKIKQLEMNKINVEVMKQYLFINQCTQNNQDTSFMKGPKESIYNRLKQYVQKQFNTSIFQV